MDNHDLKNFNFLETFIEKGDVLVDVGANYGDYTNFFLEHLGDSGKIYSFELDPNTTIFLEQRFKDNSNVKIFNKAVTNENSKINYYKGVDAWTNNIIGHDMSFRPNQLAGQVDGIRLDSFLSHEENIKLIKIDVEGAEKFVLEGLDGIIDKISYILVECHIKHEWDVIKEMLFVKYNLTCLDLDKMKKINYNSKKPYQCFCMNKKNIL